MVQSAINQSGHADKMRNLLFSIIALGVLTIIVSMFGFCGACHDSSCLLGAYSICLVFMFAAELTVGVICIIYKSDVIKNKKKLLIIYFRQRSVLLQH